MIDVTETISAVRRFVTASSDGWYEANVAFGADPAGARTAAGRTTAFYTGTR